MVGVHDFINKLRESFGEIELPIAVGYSEQPMAEVRKRGHCIMASMKRVRQGDVVSFSRDTIDCNGGSIYTGYGELNERVPHFVSQVERYKCTPEAVAAAITAMQIPPAPAPYLNFARIDQVESLDDMEGIFFYATPDVLAGLVNWAFFDNTWDDAVKTVWGSGCNSTVTNLLTENRRGGHSCYLGMFDISVRPMVGRNELTFAIPMSRLEQMTDTMDKCFFNGSKAWERVKKRING
jgi:hypothetical protein